MHNAAVLLCSSEGALTSYWLNQLGLLAQFAGAAYLVYVAYRGWLRFSIFSPQTKYGELAALLSELTKAQITQFGHQLVGFALLSLGTVAQLVANTVGAS
jgi:hypothetical protein